ncbi:hypothetical protein AVEN_53447-1 [Araneus ventricosus]|uniref:Uncharacterized protein n=1 Tax=Araneus ventricosus TaxID=182803 RepID=A0A4Y2AB20_ARAVE|nr:hypothetical protein AVEN_53447-1 [Araneus ventricosus]
MSALRGIVKKITNALCVLVIRIKTFICSGNSDYVFFSVYFSPAVWQQACSSESGRARSQRRPHSKSSAVPQDTLTSICEGGSFGRAAASRRSRGKEIAIERTQIIMNCLSLEEGADERNASFDDRF